MSTEPLVELFGAREGGFLGHTAQDSTYDAYHQNLVIGPGQMNYV